MRAFTYKPIRSLLLVGFVIHVCLTAWLLLVVFLSPSHIADLVASIGTVLFFLHSLVAGIFDPFPRGEESFRAIFVTLLVTFPVSLLWAFCFRGLYRTWQYKRRPHENVVN